MWVTTGRSLTSALKFLIANMKFNINSVEGRLLNVTFSFDDGTVLNKNLDLQPIGHDAIDDKGKPCIVKVDPLEDVKGYLENWMQAYLRGKEVEARTVDAALLAKDFTVEAIAVEDVAKK